MGMGSSPRGTRVAPTRAMIMIENPSLWVATAASSRYSPLGRDREVDVAIVGAGITGLTAGLVLARAGKRVAILESRHVASGVTGFTTAHLTQAVDARYRVLASRFGAEGARTVAESTKHAIDRIEAFVAELGIACDFARVPGYLYTEREADVRELEEELEAARNAGIAVNLVRDVPLPFATAAAVRFDGQAQFHIGKYAEALATAAVSAGCEIFEMTHVSEVIEGETCELVTEGGKVRASHVIFATNSPLTRTFVQTKIHSYRSYAIAFPAKNDVPAALYWDTDDPYHYTRTVDVDGGRYLIVGGEDHKTGHDEDTEKRYAALLAYAQTRFAVSDVAYRWSAQVLEPVDGLPYIGATPHAANVFVATGYSGTGMTFGTLAGEILSDHILGRENAYAELYAATRVKLSTIAHYVAENVDTSKFMVTDRLRGGDVGSIDEVRPGEGKLVSVDGKKLAVYRTDSGEVRACSAVCPHLGCIVHFNSAEKTWDCPCHGSRFDTQGTVLHGPSLTGLARAEAVDDQEPTLEAAL